MAAIVGGILYRLGGIGKPFNTKIRDFGVPLVIVGLIHFVFKWQVPWWVHFLSYGLMFGVLTTYWEYWGSDDVEWYEWALTGFFYGLSAILYAWQLNAWIGFGIRVFVLTVFTCVWSVLMKKPRWEEWGRGAGMVVTLPLLII